MLSPFQVHTFGCKVNSYDSSLIEKKLEQHVFKTESKVHVLNTCAVTEEAVKQAVRLARKIKSMDPFSLVVVTGCGSQVETEKFAAVPAVDLVVANSHKAQLGTIIENFYKLGPSQKVFKSNIFKKDELEEGYGERESHTRVFLKIQDGCNSFCTYCVIPYARGKSRSLSVSDLVNSVKKFQERGVKEIVLTGIHIGDYESGDDRLEDLVEALLEKTSIPRIRLTSLEPVEVTEKLLNLFSDDRLCPHFHLSIQSANDQVLKAMKRKYTQKDVISVFERIHKVLKNPFIGMDLIVGFANETEECFKDTYQVLKSLPWTKIHTFPYSERPGTRAVGMKWDCSQADKILRAKKIRELSEKRFSEEQKKQLGTKKEALMLKDSLLTKDYWKVLVPQALTEHRGKEFKVLIQKSQKDFLLGEILGWN